MASRKSSNDQYQVVRDGGDGLVYWIVFADSPQQAVEKMIAERGFEPSPLWRALPTTKYGFKRNEPDGTTTTLIGAEVDAISPEMAMRMLRLCIGYTAEQGGYTVEIA